jgi:hypothetical protein
MLNLPRRHSAVLFDPSSVHETEYLDTLDGFFDLKKNKIIVEDQLADPFPAIHDPATIRQLRQA